MMEADLFLLLLPSGVEKALALPLLLGLHVAVPVHGLHGQQAVLHQREAPARAAVAHRLIRNDAET